MADGCLDHATVRLCLLSSNHPLRVSAFWRTFAESVSKGYLKMRSNLRLVTGLPATEMQKEGRKTDAAYGRDAHKYLTPSQVESLIKASGKRDALMISLAYHHGLRVSELISLEWSAIDLKAGTIVIRRAKGGIGGAQHLERHDRAALARIKADNLDARFVFVSKRHGIYRPLSRDAFAKLLATAGECAGIDRRLCHPHALRHAAGHALANSGRVNAFQLQAVLGHKDARSTQIYVQGVEGLIKGLWD
jgi:type 1 fimbriae regulatory protein FimB/type 1 fimbriae regulatory protein FimE